MCSALTERGASSTFDALARGAKDYVMKPTQQADLSTAIDLLSVQLLPKIAVLAGFSKVSGGRAADPPVPAAPRKESAGGESDRIDIVVIGVSTGGPAALEQLLPMLPAQFPVPVLIVQHMPKLFTGVLAERLNKICRGPVAEGRDGGAVTEGMFVLAPGDAHMEVAAGLGSHSQLRLHQGVPLNSCKPSVDYLFQSAARLFGPSTLALVLTGMGSDGLDGARAIRQAGGTVFAQDEASSAVWGMPGRVVREGIAHQTLPLKAMALAVQQRVLGRPAALRSRRLGQAVNSQPNHSASNREVRHGLL
jgi:two-component system chemotaxis response regulator CheB